MFEGNNEKNADFLDFGQKDRSINDFPKKEDEEDLSLGNRDKKLPSDEEKEVVFGDAAKFAAMGKRATDSVSDHDPVSDSIKKLEEATGSVIKERDDQKEDALKPKKKFALTPGVLNETKEINSEDGDEKDENQYKNFG